ncbi:hypothetical protein AJ80_05168 [Polytolypa hystricis UAMH7299]|uniref:CS domain-containing protein n=1 Tax=Polytolypa hystricis (strain UAMH7299) TaxID=1447883 RepID=A0A2B7Y630_POLH7|nr:hypothetical protein AJ80_05168 [Polytolypa hystricis UAMH7299]
MAQTPEVLWAQRSHKTDPAKNFLHVSISVADVKPESAKLNLTPTSVSFSGHSDTKKVDYAVELQLWGEIDVDNSKSHHSPRGIELQLRKKELTEEYWPRLLKDSRKVHFLKTDFDKWVDEDEQDEAEEDLAGGFPAGGDNGLGGIDFSKLGAGGMPGMPGMGDMGDMGGFGAGEEEDDDDEMPELEDPSGSKPEAAESKPKIEEVA